MVTHSVEDNRTLPFIPRLIQQSTRYWVPNEERKTGHGHPEPDTETYFGETRGEEGKGGDDEGDDCTMRWK